MKYGPDDRKNSSLMIDRRVPLDIVVVGGINIDISGTSDFKMILGDSNPGQVWASLGGVGRNIAENLSRLNCSCRMITALGKDMHLPMIRESCQKLHIDLSCSPVIPGARNGIYLCVNDEAGDVVAAISDMKICEAVTPQLLEKHLQVLNGADFVVVDANVPEASLYFLAEHCHTRIVADTVSSKKAGRLAACLDRLWVIKPNRAEAELLTGVPLHDTLSLQRASRVFLEKGTKHVFISLGSQGVYYADAEDSGIQPCHPAAICNTNGCGDAFLAAASLALAHGHPIQEAAQIGQAASAICAKSEHAVSPELTLQQLEADSGIPL